MQKRLDKCFFLCILHDKTKYNGTNNKSMNNNYGNKNLLFWGLALISIFSIFTPAFADTLPTYLKGNTDAMGTLGRFMNGALKFLSSLLWGIWAIFAVLFAKDLMMGKDAEELKGQVLKLGGAALILLMITALPALFAGFAN